MNEGGKDASRESAFGGFRSLAACYDIKIIKVMRASGSCNDFGCVIRSFVSTCFCGQPVCRTTWKLERSTLGLRRSHAG